MFALFERHLFQNAIAHHSCQFLVNYLSRPTHFGISHTPRIQQPCWQRRRRRRVSGDSPRHQHPPSPQKKIHFSNPTVRSVTFAAALSWGRKNASWLPPLRIQFDPRGVKWVLTAAVVRSLFSRTNSDAKWRNSFPGAFPAKEAHSHSSRKDPSLRSPTYNGVLLGNWNGLNEFWVPKLPFFFRLQQVSKKACEM